MKIYNITIWLGLTAYFFGIFFSNSVLQIAIGILLCCSGHILRWKYQSSNIEIIDIAIITFFFSGILAWLISPKNSETYTHLMHHLALLSTIPVSYIFVHKKRPTILEFAYIAVFFAAITASAGIANYIRNPFRAYGFFAGPYSLANIMVLSLPFSIALLMYSKKWNWFRIFTLLSIALQTAALWLTFTRGAIGGVIIGFGAGLLIWYKQVADKSSKRIKKPVYIYLSFVGLILSLMLNSQDLRINPISYFSPDARAVVDLSSGRLTIIKEALAIQQKNIEQGNWSNILFGYGLRSRKTVSEFKTGGWESDYLGVLMNQGVFGLFCVLWIYFLLFKKVREKLMAANGSRYYPFYWAVAVCAIAFWIMSFVTSELNGMNSSAQIAILFALLASASNSDCLGIA